jgi:hypothetical protein
MTNKFNLQTIIEFKISKAIKKGSILFLFLILGSCSYYYFFENFDEIEYYTLKKEINYDAIEKDTLLAKVIYEDFPFIANDASFFEKTNSLFFKKQKINSKDHLFLKEIFSERFNLIPLRNKCAPTYRDILVFKKNKKIIGIAKLCFECELSYFTGNTVYSNTYDFGQNNEFEDLNNILIKYKN